MVSEDQINLMALPGGPVMTQRPAPNATAAVPAKKAKLPPGAIPTAFVFKPRTPAAEEVQQQQQQQLPTSAEDALSAELAVGGAAPMSTEVLPSEVPIIVAKCVEYLESDKTKSLLEVGLFRESASAGQLKAYKTAFDNNEQPDLFVCKDQHVIAGLLKLYFRSSPRPIFPQATQTPFYNALQSTTDNDKRIEGFRRIFQTEVDPQNQRILKFLFKHLLTVTQFSNINKMSALNLAICWAPTLFQSAAQMANVVEFMIMNYDQIFN